MQNTGFSIRSAAAFGWHKAIAFLPYLVGIFLLRALLGAVPGYLQGIRLPLIGELALSIATIFCQYALGAIITVIALAVVDGEQVTMALLQSKVTLKMVVVLALTSFVVGLLVALGLLVFILPGIIISLMFCLINYIVVDKGLGFRESFVAARSLTKGHRAKLWLLFLVEGGINVLGFLCLGVGLLVTIPMTTLMTAFVYRELSK